MCYQNIAIKELQKMLGLESTPEAATRQEGDTTHLDMELPGVRKEDITVDVKDGLLTVKAEKKSPPGEALRGDRWFGTYKASYRLGDTLDPSTLQAVYADGVLTLSVGKAAGSSARKIEIQ